MAGANNHHVPDLVEEFLSAATEKQKIDIEEDVFHKILTLWESLQKLQLLYYSGEANTPRLLAKLEKYREYLHISELTDPFDEDRMYELMLRKERNTLNDITDSENYRRASTMEVRRWMHLWKIFVEEKYFDVIRSNFVK